MDLTVAHITHVYPPSIGGVQNHVFFLTRELNRLGIKVYVYTTSEKCGRNVNNHGITVFHVGITSQNKRRAHRIFSNYASLLHWIFRILEAERRIDMIHIHAPFSPKLFTLLPRLVVTPQYLLKRLHLIRIPVIATFHGLWYHYLPSQEPIDKIAVRASDTFIGVDRSICRGLHDHYGIEKDRIFFIPNGVDLSMFQEKEGNKSEDSRIILVPRRIDPKNGVIFAVRAFGIIAEEFPDAQLMLVGFGGDDHSYEQRVVEEISCLRLKSRVKMLSLIPTSKMPDLYSSSYVSMVPSLWEATSLAVLESMCMGVPVIASNTGGLRDIVDESVGYLHEPGNAISIADKLREALSDSQGYRKRVNACKRRAREFGWDAIAKKTLHVYKLALRIPGG